MWCRSACNLSALTRAIFIGHKGISPITSNLDSRAIDRRFVSRFTGAWLCGLALVQAWALSNFLQQVIPRFNHADTD